MSSEMRELIAKWRDLAQKSDSIDLQQKGQIFRWCANDLEALLARTEAGADGAVAWGLMYPADHEQRGTLWNVAVEKESAEQMQTACWNAGDDLIVPLYLHPQDASGDAVDWKDEYRFQRAMRYMDNNDELTKQRADEMADEDIRRIEAHAMQAKEAK